MFGESGKSVKSGRFKPESGGRIQPDYPAGFIRNGWQDSTGFSSSFDTRFTGIAVDSSDNIYAVGFINGTDTYDFGNSITASGTYLYWNALVAKYQKDTVK